MCFLIDIKNHPKKKIAKRNIYGYKVVRSKKNKYLPQFFVNEATYIKGRMAPKIKLFKYSSTKISELKETISGINFPILHPDLIIHEGYHSYSCSSKERLLSEKSEFLLTRNLVPVKICIPKGTGYYYNSKSGERVSETFIIIKEI